MTPINRLFHLLRASGHGRYGGAPVSQYEHAVQCAMRAEAERAPAPLIVAALLHDIGHLTNAGDRAATERGEDAQHERIGAALLAMWFGEAVAAPVRLHVSAKRYLTAVEPGYAERLSPDSVQSLALQGGPFTTRETKAFTALPHAADAVRLRRWDEAAKIAGAPLRDLDHFRPYLETALGGGAS